MLGNNGLFISNFGVFLDKNRPKIAIRIILC
jgi:hypothetical protein